MEKGDATDVWYWEGFPRKTLEFEQKKSAPEYKSSKEGLTVMCCGNIPGNHKLKLAVTGKAKRTTNGQGCKSHVANVVQLSTCAKCAWHKKGCSTNGLHKGQATLMTTFEVIFAVLTLWSSKMTPSVHYISLHIGILTSQH